MINTPNKFLTAFIASSLVAGLPVAGALAAVVKGKILDDTGEPLPGASVSLVSLVDTTSTAKDASSLEGDFAFKDVKPGRYMLLFSMPGLKDAGRSIEVTDSAETNDIGSITLSENSTLLDEAVVTAVRAAVVAKEDTLEFNAESFRTGKNASVEDLLKKLPGVEVGSDGSIKSGGKTVTKILVDGKEFFADDPKVASKNLPSDIVEKVQVVDRKSDAARLTGIDDGDDETVINLTVKKGMNNGWFGTISGGYGTDNRYTGNLNASYFRNGNQITILGSGNNINESGFSDRGRGRFRDFGGNNGINSTQMAGLNFNIGKDEYIRVGGNIFYNHSDRHAISRSAVQYLFPDYTNLKNSNSETRDKGHNIRADLRLQWNINENNVLEFRPRFAFNNRNSESISESVLLDAITDGSKINSDNSSRYNHGTSYEASGELIYNHKFPSKKGRSFSVMANYSFSNTTQHSTSLSKILYYLKEDDSESLLRYLDSREWSNYVQGRLTYTEPLGDPSRGNYLNFAYRANYRWNNGDRMTYNVPLADYATDSHPDFESIPAGSVVDNTLSNRFRNGFMTQELQVGYKKVASAYNLDAGMLFAPSYSQSTDLINSERNIPRQWVWNIAPYLRFRYKFSKTSSLNLNYRARTSQPSISALQPVADVSDPLNIVIGNPELKPTFTQSVMGHFNSFDMTSQRSLFAVFNVSYAMNSVVSRTITDQATGVRTTTYTNANGNVNVFGMGMLNQPVGNRKWRLNARLGVNYSNNAGYIDGRFNRSGNLVLNPSLGATFSIDIAQFSLNPTYSFNMATNSLPDQQSQYVHAYGFDASAVIQLPFGLDLSTDLNFSKSSGYKFGYNSEQWLWNAQISYSILSDKSLTFSVRAYDILGQKKNITRSVSANMITDSEYNDLTRYVMFGITWKFNTMSKRKAAADNTFDGMLPPPPEQGQGNPPAGERPQSPPPGHSGPFGAPNRAPGHPGGAPGGGPGGRF